MTTFKIDAETMPLAHAYWRAHHARHVHVTRVGAAGEIFGHTTDKCDDAGCAGDELYWPSLIDGARGDVVEIDDPDLEEIADRARDAWRDSDEPRLWRISDGNGEDDVTCRPSEIQAEMRAWVESGDYDCSGESRTVFIDVTATPIDPVTEEAIDHRESATIVLPATAPRCKSRNGHEWKSPHSVVGGLRENPGVHGHGGGVIIREVCVHCGVYKITDTWAQHPATGVQGYRTVEYAEGDEDSLEWCESRGSLDE